MQKILCFVIAGLAGLVLAEGTVVETKTFLGSPAKYELAWTASTNGIVSQATTFYVRGTIERAVLTGVSNSALQYVKLLDQSSVDVLAGQGDGIASNAVSKINVVPGIKLTDGVQSNSVQYVVNDLLTLSVTNVNSLATGSVILYVK